MITSAQNSRLKLVRALLTQPKSRRREQKIVLEGVRLIDDVMAQGFTPEFILYQDGVEHPTLNDTENAFAVEPSLLNALSDTQTSQGFLAVFPMPDLMIPDTAQNLVALDGVRDPGNIGTIARTAAAAGIDGLLLLSGTVDPFNPKAVRAGMGAHFRLPMRSLDWKVFSEHYTDGWRIWLADVHATDLYHQVDWTPPNILIIGNEAHGLSEAARQYATHGVKIPMARDVESLNTATAAAILMFEIQRGRV